MFQHLYLGVIVNQLCISLAQMMFSGISDWNYTATYYVVTVVTSSKTIRHVVIGIQKCHHKPSLIVFKEFSFLSCELFDVYKVINSRYFAINKLMKLKYTGLKYMKVSII